MTHEGRQRALHDMTTAPLDSTGTADDTAIVRRDAYARAGVHVETANELVSRFRQAAALTTRPEVAAGVGGFAGLFRWPGPSGPGHLVSGTDGVGTKVELARQVADLHPERAGEIYADLGQDLVAMCVNDTLCAGAAPLFFLDYVAAGRLVPDLVVAVVEGVARACADVGAALLGGETAEMPGVYADDAFDVAGFVVGWVPQALGDRLRLGPRDGDVAIGLASGGLHSNGFSLVRNILNDTITRGKGPRGTQGDVRPEETDAYASLLDSMPEGLAGTLAETLLRPTRLYVKPVLAALDALPIRGLANITGGGLTDNPPRALADDLAVVLEEGAWPEPPIFGWLAAQGGLGREDMRRAFNLGLGMVLYVDAGAVDATIAHFAEQGVAAYRVGRVETMSTESSAARVRFL